MAGRLNQDVVSKFLSRVNVDFDEEQKVTETKLPKNPQAKTNEPSKKPKNAVPKKEEKTKSDAKNTHEGKKVLRSYFISKSQYFGLVRKKLDSGEGSVDISSIVRIALEEYLAEVPSERVKQSSQYRKSKAHITNDEMLMKGFYLTETLIDAIKAFAYHNKINDSDVVRSAIASYLNR